MKKKSREKIEHRLQNMKESEKLLNDQELDFVYSQFSYGNLYSCILSMDILDQNPFTDKMEQYFYECTFNKMELIRFNAAEYLHRSRNLGVLRRLKELMKDSSHLVRGYAVGSYLEVLINIEGYTHKTVQMYLQAVKELEYRREKFVGERKLCFL